MAFELPTLPYSKTALAGERHVRGDPGAAPRQAPSGLCHGAERLRREGPALQGKSLEEIVKLSHGKADMAPVFNNAGQHWNHILFWQSMSPNGGGIPGKLETKINGRFRRRRAVQGRVQGGGVGQFGSGWVWLVLGRDGKLKVTRDAERVQPAGHRRGQGAARLRRVGAQLLPGFPQSPAGLPAELAGQAGELRIRRGAVEGRVAAYRRGAGGPARGASFGPDLTTARWSEQPKPTFAGRVRQRAPRYPVVAGGSDHAGTPESGRSPISRWRLSAVHRVPVD